MTVMTGAAILICALVLSSGRVLRVFDSLVYIAVGVAAFFLGWVAAFFHANWSEQFPFLMVFAIITADFWLSRRYRNEAVKLGSRPWSS